MPSLLSTGDRLCESQTSILPTETHPPVRWRRQSQQCSNGHAKKEGVEEGELDNPDLAANTGDRGQVSHSGVGGWVGGDGLGLRSWLDWEFPRKGISPKVACCVFDKGKD